MFHVFLDGQLWYVSMFIVFRFYYYGVCLPIYSMFCKVNCFPN